MEMIMEQREKKTVEIFAMECKKDNYNLLPGVSMVFLILLLKHFAMYDN